LPANRPNVFEGNPHYSNLFTAVNARLVGVDLMLKTGRLMPREPGSTQSGKDFYDLRKASGVVVLADACATRMPPWDALMVYNDRALDWSEPGTDAGIASKASAYGTVLDRCDSTASESVRQMPEFRRLIDGAKASLELIPKAIATRDADLLHRVLIELRSFDNLLDSASADAAYSIRVIFEESTDRRSLVRENKVGSHVTDSGIFFSRHHFVCGHRRFQHNKRICCGTCYV
jgi:hypothetical protein